ncbi:hypothetical protein BMS3Abin02_01607 [bacterium BMS3Abin02]|nr:hypothetical protein BMS3Abin02_01607 [bacterium BMS3Abin02]
MDTASDREEMFLQAPVACAFLLLCDQLGVPLDEAVRPPAALDLAAGAISDMYPWAGDHEQRKVAVVERAARLRHLVPRLLEHPDSSWWFASLERDRQVWLGTSRVQMQSIEVPSEAPPPREYTPQMPPAYFLTATRYGERTAFHSLLAQWAGDWDPELPLPQADLHVADDARVFEIRSPQDWYELADRYAVVPVERGEPMADRQIFPHWTKVAADWDIVHLSFGGFLLATFVPIAGPLGSARLWTWESESALWLRPCYSDRIEQEPLVGRPRSAFEGVGVRIRHLRTLGGEDARLSERWGGPCRMKARSRRWWRSRGR